MVSRSPLEVCWATPPDLDDIASFWRQQYGAQSVQATPGRTRWLFADQPDGLAVAMARVDGRIVAACGHVVQNVQIHGHGPCQAAFGIDFMVAPEFRRQGIASRILELRLDRFPLSLSTGQSQSMSSVYADRGGSDLGAFQRAIGRTRLTESLSLRSLVRDGLAVIKGRRARRFVTGRIPFQVMAQSPDQLDPWLRWRFAGPVYRDYHAFRVNNPAAEGLAVTRQQGPHEILAHAQGTGPRSSILKHVLGSSPSGAVDALFVGQRLAHDFEAAGYLVRPHDARLFAVAGSRELSAALVPGCIDLFSCASDADLLRKPTPVVPRDAG